MPVLKLSLTEEEAKLLSKLAEEKNLTCQDYIRSRILGIECSEIFTPEEAERRALEKFAEEGEKKTFTLPDIYGEDWNKLNPRMTGVFGKRFFNHTKTSEFIEFAGMSENGRRATYCLKEGVSL